MTFKDLTRLEPGLLSLLREAETQYVALKTYRQRKNYWYSKLKPKMYALVGCASKHEDQRLHTSVAYDAAYDALYYALTGESLIPEPKQGVTYA